MDNDARYFVKDVPPRPEREAPFEPKRIVQGDPSFNQTYEKFVAVIEARYREKGYLKKDEPYLGLHRAREDERAQLTLIYVLGKEGALRGGLGYYRFTPDKLPMQPEYQAEAHQIIHNYREKIHKADIALEKIEEAIHIASPELPKDGLGIARALMERLDPANDASPELSREHQENLKQLLPVLRQLLILGEAEKMIYIGGFAILPEQGDLSSTSLGEHHKQEGALISETIKNLIEQNASLVAIEVSDDHARHYKHLGFKEVGNPIDLREKNTTNQSGVSAVYNLLILTREDFINTLKTDNLVTQEFIEYYLGQAQMHPKPSVPPPDLQRKIHRIQRLYGKQFIDEQSLRSNFWDLIILALADDPVAANRILRDAAGHMSATMTH